MIFCMYIFWHETGDKTFRKFRVESMFLLVKYKKSGKLYLERVGLYIIIQQYGLLTKVRN